MRLAETAVTIYHIYSNTGWYWRLVVVYELLHLKGQHGQKQNRLNIRVCVFREPRDWLQQHGQVRVARFP